MHTLIEIKKYKETDEGTELLVSVPGKQLGNMLVDKHINKAEIRFDDGRTISAEQRKKAYATLQDISTYTGYSPEETKQVMKFLYCVKTGNEEFSLADCSMDTAREFINIMIDFCLENGVQLSESGILRTDDVGRYLYMCLKTRKCCICGAEHADIHHVDAIGAGRNRTKVDDSEMRKMALCRMHHSKYHQIGRERFENMYHVYGIIVKDVEVDWQAEEMVGGE